MSARMPQAGSRLAATRFFTVTHCRGDMHTRLQAQVDSWGCKQERRPEQRQRGLSLILQEEEKED